MVGGRGVVVLVSAHMLPRLLTTLLVFFWLGSMSWLALVVWAPPESRMAEIDPREVYRVFFAWNDSADMTLLENGARRGLLKVTGGSGENRDTGEFENLLSLAAWVEQAMEADGSRILDLTTKGNFFFEEEMAFRNGDFSLRVPNKQLNSHFTFHGTESFQARVMLGGVEIFSFDSSKNNVGALPSSAPLGMLLPGGELPNPADMEWEAEARMGKFPFGGRDLRAYLLILRLPEQGQEIRAFFSEAGEPLKIETGLGFEAVSEVLVPLDAYLPGKSKSGSKTKNDD